jgi:hypothetical protein
MSISQAVWPFPDKSSIQARMSHFCGAARDGVHIDVDQFHVGVGSAAAFFAPGGCAPRSDSAIGLVRSFWNCPGPGVQVYWLRCRVYM